MSFGYATVAYLGRSPLRLHWTLPLGALVVSGGHFAPYTWAAFAFLILVHELGHAFLVRRYHHAVVSIDLHGLGGHCRWSGYASELEKSKIAWGGVLAQGIVLLLSDRLVRTFPSLATGRGAEVMQTLLVANFAIIGLNLLPIPFLDGLQAWQLFRWVNVVAFARWLVAFPRSLYLRVKLGRLSRRAKHLRSIDRGEPRSKRDWLN
jgi:hypothetical protein